MLEIQCNHRCYFVVRRSTLFYLASNETSQIRSWEMATFRVADASEYLAITGWGIHDVKLAKKAWVFVGQQCKKFSISPVNYEFEVHAMSAEKLPFILPAVFTIGQIGRASCRERVYVLV